MMAPKCCYQTLVQSEIIFLINSATVGNIIRPRLDCLLRVMQRPSSIDEGDASWDRPTLEPVKTNQWRTL